MKMKSWLAIPVLVVSTACGGSSSFEGRPNTEDRTELEDLPAAIATAYCSAFERCSGIYYEVIFGLEDCETLLERQFRDGGFAELERAVDGETVIYDPASASSCLDVVSTRACAETVERDIPECEEATKGTVDPGGDCDIDAECIGSRICRTADACPGTCVERYGQGEECAEDDECADGLVCSEATTPGRCVAPSRENDACGGGVGGEPQCIAGLTCIGENPATAETGICRPFEDLDQRRAGETCDLEAGILCESGVSCVLASIAGDFVCRTIPASGGACGIGFPENCPRGEYCPITEVDVLLGMVEASCEPLPIVGAACAERPLDILAACEAYARCGADGNCIGLRNLGESCTSDELCYSEACVSGGCAPARTCQ